MPRLQPAQNELTVAYLKRIKGELSEDQYTRLLRAFVDDMESKIEKMDGEVRNICN